MSDKVEIVAGAGAADPGDAPDVNVNGGDPLPDDPPYAPAESVDTEE